MNSNPCETLMTIAGTARPVAWKSEVRLQNDWRRVISAWMTGTIFR